MFGEVVHVSVAGGREGDLLLVSHEMSIRQSLSNALRSAARAAYSSKGARAMRRAGFFVRCALLLSRRLRDGLRQGGKSFSGFSRRHEYLLPGVGDGYGMAAIGRTRRSS